jgi:hypothetical protein
MTNDSGGVVGNQSKDRTDHDRPAAELDEGQDTSVFLWC